jgi:hypothetical protein
MKVERRYEEGTLLAGVQRKDGKGTRKGGEGGPSGVRAQEEGPRVRVKGEWRKLECRMSLRRRPSIVRAREQGTWPRSLATAGHSSSFRTQPTDPTLLRPSSTAADPRTVLTV